MTRLANQTRVPSKHGFTLVEILVGIAIIVLLIGLLLPAVFRARTNAAKIRTQADFQTIGIALDAYKADFGDYPRPPQISDSTFGTVGQSTPDSGAAELVKALIGPGGNGYLPPNDTTVDDNDPPKYSSSVKYAAGQPIVDSNKYYVAIKDVDAGVNVTTKTSWVQGFDPRDGADGPGFRTRKAASGNAPVGKVWGPYLQVGKIPVSGFNLIDLYGHSILYFVAAPSRPDITQGVVDASGAAKGQGYVDRSAFSRYNANDNFEQFRRDGETDTIPLARIRLMLGDYNTDGLSKSSDKDAPATNSPYLLWSAGPDSVFGPVGYTPPTTPTADDIEANRKAAQKCDDVTNFQQ